MGSYKDAQGTGGDAQIVYSGPAKPEVRAATLLRRDALPLEIRQRHSAAILKRLFALPVFREARTVAAYCSFGSEVETMPLLSAILEQGKILVLPKVDRERGTLHLHPIEDLYTDLCPGIWGISEPNPSRDIVSRSSKPDLVLIPGVAFDRKGNRIGYGKGYYDKLLTGYHQAGHNPAIVALAFEIQIWETLPAEIHDVAINKLITEDGEW